jgi:hypothetical protein
VRTFLHGSCRLTMSVATLPSDEALPGEDRGQVWTWLRPRGATADMNRAVRRCVRFSASRAFSNRKDSSRMLVCLRPQHTWLCRNALVTNFVWALLSQLARLK